ncbi:MAG: 4-(cytidine 5'-diphospho)-2-C-methyl-D-erythritol kinase [Calditrichaeota bacterium]|nr:MAG: 4-(cytidine 5'-diphospho)-2-C-methyl-D-erythritol kinase [Calditrichota bacterium]
MSCRVRGPFCPAGAIALLERVSVMELHVPSYAKINLGLWIKGRRDDGFHEIETLLLQVSLKDDIVISDSESDEIELLCSDPTLPGGDDNLCVRAARLLQREAQVGRGAVIRLQKKIPAGAGLGGGSSNAAVVLLALNRLWGLDYGAERLQELAAELGSDVPFFIRGGAALARGRGEILEQVEWRLDLPILLVCPGISVSTAWAYGQFTLDLTMTKKNVTLPHFKGINFNDVDFLGGIENEFEQVVFPKFPILAEIKENLRAQAALYAGLSGSGSAVFGIFRREQEVLEAKRGVSSQFRTFVVRPMRWGIEQMSMDS